MKKDLISIQQIIDLIADIEGNNGKSKLGKINPKDPMSGVVKEIQNLSAKFKKLKNDHDLSDSKLFESNHILESILNNTPAGIAILMGPDFRYVSINKNLAEMNGLSVKDHLGKTLKEVLPEASNALLPVMKKMMKDGKANLGREFSITLPKNSDKPFHLVDYLFPIPDEEGKPMGIGAIVLDVTKRKEAEDLLLNSQQLYSSLVSNANDGIYITAPEYLEFINPAFEQFSGYKFDEICNDKFDMLRLIHPDDHRLINKRIKDRKASKKIKSRYEFKFVTKSGDIKNVEVSTVPHPNEKGKVVGILRDITDKKKTERALEKSEKKYRQLIEQANDIIYTADLAGRFTFVNTDGIKLTGYSKKAVLKMHFNDLVHPDHRDKTRKFYSDQIKKNIKSTYYEYPIVTKNGSTIWLGQNVQLMNNNGSVSGIQAVARDISRRKEMESAIQRAKDELEEKVNERTNELHETNVELIKNKDELLRTTDQLRIILDSQPVVTYLSKAEGDYGATYISSSVVEMTGYTPEDFISLASFWSDNIHPDDINRVLSELPILFERGIHEHEYRWKIKDGTYRWFFDSLRVVKDKNGKTTHLAGMWQDITERKIAEIKLQESEQSLKSALHIAKLGHWNWDLQTDEAILSDEYNKIFNLKKNEPYGTEEFMNLIHPDDREAFLQIVEESKKNENKSHSMGYRILLNGNEIKYIHSEWKVYKGADNIATRLEGTVQDVTENKMAEIELVERTKKLLESELRFDLAVQASEDGLWDWDIKTNKSFLSKRWKEILGYKESEVEGTYETWATRIHPDHYEYVMNSLKEHLEEKKPYKVEYLHKHKSGEYRWQYSCGEAQFDENGKPYRMVGFIRDITESKKAEDKFRTLFEAAPDAMILTNKEGQIKFINNETLRMFGYNKDELAGKNIDLLIPERFLTDHHSHFEGFHSNPMLMVMGEGRDLRALRKDGSEFPVEIGLRPIKSGESAEVITTIRDISEKKKIENEQKELAERLQQSKRMESLGVLAGGIAHDLNNMLGPILAYPDLILSELSEDTPVKNELLMIKESAKSASQLIYDMLTLARRGRYIMVKVNLNDILASYFNSANAVELRKENNEITIAFDLDMDLKNINGSAIHLSKVIMNLVINAFEAIPDRIGSITIKTFNKDMKPQSMLFDDLKGGSYSVLTITDTGEGISEEDLPHIFEPFYSKKEMGVSGSGLGLSIIWGIVKDHAGYIDITTELGKSTKFSIYFPTTDIIDDKPPNDLSILKGTESILVVDDESNQRRVAQRVLNTLGYDVSTVATSSDAVEYLKLKGADLVILDMVMESEDAGLQLYKKIKELKPGQRTIIVSGYSDSIHVTEALDLGIGSFTNKPYTVEILGKVVRDELDRNAD